MSMVGMEMTRSDGEGSTGSESEAVSGSTPTRSGPLPPPSREERERDPEAPRRWWESLRVEHGESEVMIQVPSPRATSSEQADGPARPTIRLSLPFARPQGAPRGARARSTSGRRR